MLLNETLIHEASLAVWLVCFGLLPVLLHRLLLAIERTVDKACAQNYDQLYSASAKIFLLSTGISFL